MRKYYATIERTFDNFSEKALIVFGNSIPFILVCFLVVYWIAESVLIKKSHHEVIRDIFLAISFLNFFIIQKSFNRYSKALHVKLNELVFATEDASNEIINAERKSEDELEDLKKKYDASGFDSEKE